MEDLSYVETDFDRFLLKVTTCAFSLSLADLGTLSDTNIWVKIDPTLPKGTIKAVNTDGTTAATITNIQQ